MQHRYPFSNQNDQRRARCVADVECIEYTAVKAHAQWCEAYAVASGSSTVTSSCTTAAWLASGAPAATAAANSQLIKRMTDDSPRPMGGVACSLAILNRHQQSPIRGPGVSRYFGKPLEFGEPEAQRMRSSQAPASAPATPSASPGAKW